jgi:hypothetical protein
MNARARKRAGAVAASIAVLLPALAGCGSSRGDSSATAQSGTSTFPQSNEPANLNPADFTTNVDNPYFPLKVGARWEIRVTNQEGMVQHQVITVTDKTKRMADGVEARVVHDVVSENGKPVEITEDWYAQDKDGNVWYFGENTAEIKPNGQRDTSGSFEAGANGADAGVAMLAHPEVGQTYREEYYVGHAMDRTRVLAIDGQQAEVPFGHFTDVILAEDYTPVEPKVLELKFYARGIGQVLAQTVSGGSEREELISYTP